MTTIRALLANTIGSIRNADNGPTNTEYADALLASPELALIIESSLGELEYDFTPLGREAYVMVQAWRASRAEQKPER